MYETTTSPTRSQAADISDYSAIHAREVNAMSLERSLRVATWAPRTRQAHEAPAEKDEELAMTAPRSRSQRSRPVLLGAAIELVLAASVFAVYRAGRLVTSDSVSSATANAERVLDAQRWLTGPLELNVQRWMLDVPGAIDVLNHYYVFVHFPATTIFLAWAFARHRDRYPAIRNWFVGVTLVAMVIHVVFPLAPPRMLDGYVDTLREYGPNIYPEDPSRSLANQFAAMPSLHFGWALMVAIGIITVMKGRLRWWWLAHPAVTLLAIVATGNHYLLDAAIAAALAMVVGVLVLPTRLRRSDSIEPLECVRSNRLVHPRVDRHRRRDGRIVCASPSCGRTPTVGLTSPIRGASRIARREDDLVSAT
jgi:hypothetical protein